MDGCTGVGARDFCASKNTIIETNPNAPSIKADKGQQSPFLRCFIHTYIHHILNQVMQISLKELSFLQEERIEIKIMAREQNEEDR